MYDILNHKLSKVEMHTMYRIIPNIIIGLANDTAAPSIDAERQARLLSQQNHFFNKRQPTYQYYTHLGSELGYSSGLRCSQTSDCDDALCVHRCSVASFFLQLHVCMQSIHSDSHCFVGMKRPYVNSSKGALGRAGAC